MTYATKRIAGANLKGAITLSLVCGVLAADKTAAAKVRVPATGKIWGVAPRYGVSAGTTPVTDFDAQIKNGSASLFGDGVTAAGGSAAEHGLIDGSADTTTAPTALIEASRYVTEGDILQLDVNVSGGSSPTFAGYGYDVVLVPTK